MPEPEVAIERRAPAFVFAFAGVGRDPRRANRSDTGHRIPAAPAQPDLDHGYQRRPIAAAAHARSAATAAHAHTDRPSGLLPALCADLEGAARPRLSA